MSEDDVPSWARTTFWALVLVFNLALFAVGLGLMFVYFEGAWTIGTVLIGGGLIAGLGGVIVYRRMRPKVAEAV